MSEIVRLFRYRSFFGSLRVVSAAMLMKTLEISSAPLKRDFAKLRDQMHMPIEFTHDLDCYAQSFRYSDHRELIGNHHALWRRGAGARASGIAIQVAEGFVGAAGQVRVQTQECARRRWMELLK